ncbi:hypothetical protein LZ32DRAFT_183654 [Colletotrichum eremochloae]|nr:hypothetical protein LZ32DRAFT_183654 [Colletotrichum eremochloae]
MAVVCGIQVWFRSVGLVAPAGGNPTPGGSELVVMPCVVSPSFIRPVPIFCGIRYRLVWRRRRYEMENRPYVSLLLMVVVVVVVPPTPP